MVTSFSCCNSSSKETFCSNLFSVCYQLLAATTRTRIEQRTISRNLSLVIWRCYFLLPKIAVVNIDTPNWIILLIVITPVCLCLVKEDLYHFFPLAKILTRIFVFCSFHQIPQTRSPVTGTLDLCPKLANNRSVPTRTGPAWWVMARSSYV
jgi:hypothetical protein